jgi:nitroimidazol reductase NimA-like FMN-containing flavoprotein (pyridoxamine 5'-phosphate oxidase superfamily)
LLTEAIGERIEGEPMKRPPTLEGDSPTSGQRLAEYARDDRWIGELLRRGQVAHIGTRWDDQPFVTPTTYYFDETAHRLIFHSNIKGRLRANIERHPRVAAEVSEMGRLLPSNVALEFSLQYRSAMVFGTAHIIEDPTEQRAVLHHLLAKYFGNLELGKDYRPATDKELRRTSVYELRIESWSGKENWNERADQSKEWPALNEKILGAAGHK